MLIVMESGEPEAVQPDLASLAANASKENSENDSFNFDTREARFRDADEDDLSDTEEERFQIC